MEPGKSMDGQSSKWLRLINGLPGTKQEMGAEITETLTRDGYVHLKWPMSLEHYELVAGHVGTVTLRSDVKIDPVRDLIQEQARLVKGRPGIYRASPLGFHTDTLRADVLSWYCLEQDAVDGSMLFLDSGDLAEHFSEKELAGLCGIKLWNPERNPEQENFFISAPLLSREGGRFRVYYIPWLFYDSYDREASELLRKFSDYLKYKEETHLIKLRLQKRETVFIDNHRILHGRSAIAEDSKRHLVRFYIRLSEATGVTEGL